MTSPNTIKISEIFYSLQGEGIYMGVPSIFIRSFGCNFNCRNFGRTGSDLISEHQTNPEVRQIIDDIDKYKQYDDLPLVNTGCDSYAAWHPAFKHLSPNMTVEQIVEKCQSLIPKHVEKVHFVITGGEPLLPRWQKMWVELFENEDFSNMCAHITFETNGTQNLIPETINLLELSDGWDYTFSVSAKLSSSGHDNQQAIKPDVLTQYINSHALVYLKFVVGDQDDIDEIHNILQIYGPEVTDWCQVYLMPCGGTLEQYSQNAPKVARYALENGWNFSDRMQLPLFGNKWGT